MSGEFLKAHSAARGSEADDGLSGVMVGRVIHNCDHKRLGRVQVRLAARGGIEIWARVVLLDTGAYFIPQEGDQVLVAFHQGDGNEAFVVGRLWNENKKPPLQGEEDPKTKRVIRTPGEHQIAFDDTAQSVVITTKAGQHVTLKQDSVEIGVDDKDSAVISMDSKGNLKITAKNDITLSAPKITLGDSKTQINIG